MQAQVNFCLNISWGTWKAAPSTPAGILKIEVPSRQITSAAKVVEPLPNKQRQQGQKLLGTDTNTAGYIECIIQLSILTLSFAKRPLSSSSRKVMRTHRHLEIHLEDTDHFPRLHHDRGTKCYEKFSFDLSQKCVSLLGHSSQKVLWFDSKAMQSNSVSRLELLLREESLLLLTSRYDLVPLFPHLKLRTLEIYNGSVCTAIHTRTKL